MNKMPRFSIVVPIYNVEKFLRECINSILNQDCCDYELILVDDGSTDNSGRICDEYANKSDRVCVIHKVNGGLVSARRTGALAANGEYIGYVDGDDWVAECWLSEVNKVIERDHPDVVEYNAFKYIDGKSIEIKTSRFKGLFNQKEVTEIIVPCMLYDKRQRFYTFGVLPAVWSKIIKADILKENLCAEDRITFGEDVACVYNSILECKSFYGINMPLYYYRQNRESMTKAYDPNRFERLGILFDYLKKVLLPNNAALKEQYEAYVLFCMFYAALNEAKSSLNFKKMANNFEIGIKKLDLVNSMEKIPFKIGLPWNIMLYLIKKKKYIALAVLCRFIVKVKYSYKT